jgi:hypothetical protein
MPGSPKRIDTNTVGKSQQAAYQMMYLAKHSSYELRLTVSADHPALLSADRVVVQMRFRGQDQTQELAFNLEEFEALYADLGLLVAYINAERDKRDRHL